jgi:hypothetical protein
MNSFGQRKVTSGGIITEYADNQSNPVVVESNLLQRLRENG